MRVGGLWFFHCFGMGFFGGFFLIAGVDAVLAIPGEEVTKLVKSLNY